MENVGFSHEVALNFLKYKGISLTSRSYNHTHFDKLYFCSQLSFCKILMSHAFITEVQFCKVGKTSTSKSGVYPLMQNTSPFKGKEAMKKKSKIIYCQ